MSHKLFGGQFMVDDNYSLRYHKSLIFSGKLENAISNRGWSVSREVILPILPKLSYEEECDIIVEGVQAKARLNLEPRLFFRLSQKELVKCLEDLINGENPERVEVEILLNQENDDDKIKDFLDTISKLEKENEKLKSELLAYQEKNKMIVDNLEELLKISNKD